MKKEKGKENKINVGEEKDSVAKFRNRGYSCQGVINQSLSLFGFKVTTSQLPPIISILFSTKLMDASHSPSSTPVVVLSYFNPVSPFFNAYVRFARWRAVLGLPQPGTVENLQKEVKGISLLSVLFCSLSPPLATHLSNYIFDGARADLTKSLSMNPLFQVTHSFSLGSQTLPSSYSFGAIFANTSVTYVFFVLLSVAYTSDRSSSRAQSTTKAALMPDSIMVGTPTMLPRSKRKSVIFEMH